MGLFTKSFEVHDDDLLTIVKSLLKSSEPRDTVFLISPYWQMNANLRTAIKDAVTDGVRVKCIMRANEKLSSEDVTFFQESRVEIRSLPHLHAKLYLSETEALIASMNLYNYSDKESIELGVLIHDKSELEYLKDRAGKWWDDAKPFAIGGTSSTKAVHVSEKLSGSGHCIRCGSSKTFNPKYPYCDSCYKDWAKLKDETYTEKYCHRCGKKHETSMKAPQCKPCWSATK